jgi:hypothetical protein
VGARSKPWLRTGLGAGLRHVVVSGRRSRSQGEVPSAANLCQTCDCVDVRPRSAHTVHCCTREPLLPSPSVQFLPRQILTSATCALQNADHDILKYLEALSGALGATTSHAQLGKLIKRVPTEKETAKIISDLEAIDAGEVRPNVKAWDGWMQVSKEAVALQLTGSDTHT